MGDDSYGNILNDQYREVWYNDKVQRHTVFTVEYQSTILPPRFMNNNNN